MGRVGLEADRTDIAARHRAKVLVPHPQGAHEVYLHARSPTPHVTIVSIGRVQILLRLKEFAHLHTDVGANVQVHVLAVEE
jgi:hypothetical protein